jgi:DNA polymerase-1
MSAPLLVVDAPFLMYRSYFALPESITGADGRPVGALLGGANVLLRAAADREPRAIVLCFGAEAARYRVELYSPYHAARPPVPEALQWQFDHAVEFFTGFGWSCQSSAELEADDLLGSYALVEAAAGGSTLILTGDRDMYQCVGHHASVLYLKSGTAGFETVDADEVERRYGIAPTQVPDFIALRGDPSDGLPGAPGIGEKTAAELLRRHGSLEGVFAAVGTAERPKLDHGERPRVAAAVRDHAEEVRAFREIALLRTVALERPADAPTDLPGGARIAASFGLGQLSRRLEAASSLADLRL